MRLNESSWLDTLWWFGPYHYQQVFKRETATWPYTSWPDKKANKCTSRKKDTDMHVKRYKTITNTPAPWPPPDVCWVFVPYCEVSPCPTAGPLLLSPSQTPWSQSWSLCPPARCTARHDNGFSDKNRSNSAAIYLCTFRHSPSLSVSHTQTHTDISQTIKHHKQRCGCLTSIDILWCRPCRRVARSRRRLFSSSRVWFTLTMSDWLSSSIAVKQDLIINIQYTNNLKNDAID